MGGCEPKKSTTAMISEWLLQIGVGMLLSHLALADSYLLLHAPKPEGDFEPQAVCYYDDDWWWRPRGGTSDHLQVDAAPTLVKMIPKSYHLHHIDYYRSRKTGRREFHSLNLINRPAFEIQPDTIHYFGDVVVASNERNIEFYPNRETILFACEQFPAQMKEHAFVLQLFGNKPTRFDDVCVDEDAKPEQE